MPHNANAPGRLSRRGFLAATVFGAMVGLRCALAPSKGDPRLLIHDARDFVEPRPHGAGGNGLSRLHLPYSPPCQVVAWTDELEACLPPALFTITLVGDDAARWMRGDRVEQIVTRERWAEFRALPEHPWPFEGRA